MKMLLDLDNIRNVLIRLEESIIFSLVERTQFKRNTSIYTAGCIPLAGYDGSFLDYLLHGTEKLHATVRRYTSPDEHPFFDDLPAPILEPVDFGQVIQDVGININSRIKDIYIRHIIPAICSAGDDEQYGSSAVSDVSCLQTISKRIHYGIFVAESKYRAEPEICRTAQAPGDIQALYNFITDTAVEEKLLRRVERKTATYMQEIENTNPDWKIPAHVIADIYQQWIIPLTKDVEIEYLLRRPA